MVETDRHIEQRSIADIRPYDRNAKKHPDKQIAQIAASIREFGFNQPIVVDKDGVIIVGHGRYWASQKLELDKVPVIEVDLSEEKARAYRLADNRLNESDWDMDLVISELRQISTEMLDLTGFDRHLVIEDGEKDDDVPETPKVPRTHLGDLYELGDHRVLCGDATKPEDLERLMGGGMADMVFTDPPYNVNYKGSGDKTTTGIMNDKMGDEVFAVFLLDAFKAMRSVVKGGAGLYVFHSPTTQTAFEAALIANGFEIRTQLIWNKPSAGMGMGDYRSKHEPFFYAGIKGQSPQFYGDRTNTTIVDFHKSEQQLAAWAKRQKTAESEGRTTIWTMKREPVQDYVHPTQKPVELITYAIVNSSKVGDCVLDPFLGSGSTVIACEKTNRLCYGTELDPRFVDVIVTRYLEFTGGKTVIKNGEQVEWRVGV